MNKRSDKKSGGKETLRVSHVSRKAAPPAKLTRPRLSAAYRRSALHEQLDRALRAPAAWIEAQPGAGKTTLAASWLDRHGRPCLWYQVDGGDADLATFFHYLGIAAAHTAPRAKRPLPHLTPEYLPGVEIFARRFFEELFRRMPRDSVVVFDNVQDAGGNAPLHDILRIGIETLPARVKMLCLSRLPPPAPLARLQANGQLALIDDARMRLTAEEARGIAALRGHDDAAAVAAIHAATCGWTAGLVLMLESNARGAGTQDSRLLFSYFAAEVLRGMDEAGCQTLLKSSLLPRMCAADVAALTGNAEAGKLLAEFRRRNYFTYRLSPREPVYEYHPLFREFLHARLHESCAGSEGETELATLRSRAGGLLDEAGQIEEAAALWIDARDWQALAPHILKHAPRLLAEGRMHLAERWLAALPAELTDRQPWLLYWNGMCARALDPVRARGDFERAYALFEAAADLDGQYETWASVVETFALQWDDIRPLDGWIAAMERLIGDRSQFPSPQIELRVAAGMVSALTYRDLAHPDLPRWSAKLEAFVMSAAEPAARIAMWVILCFYLLWHGDYRKIALVREALKSSVDVNRCDPLTRQLWYVEEAASAAYLADWADCEQVIADGLAGAERSGVRIFDLLYLGAGVHGAVSRGDEAAAETFLSRMASINNPRPGYRSFYYFHASMVAWARGDLGLAAERAGQGARLSEDIGWTYTRAACLMSLANILFDDGRREEADSCLARAIDLGRGRVLEFIGCMSAAKFAYARGADDEGDAQLARGLAAGRQAGLLNAYCWRDRMIVPLLARALERGIETDYVLWLIRKRKLAPPEGMPVPDAWPVPIRIHALGGFAILKHGEPLNDVSGKGHNRPLGLLKTLVVLGERSVAVGRVIAQCWPGAEGDAGMNLFKINLHRLRRLLGSDTAIRFNKGRVALDAREVWVDAWAFERLREEADASASEGDEARATSLAKQALALYRERFDESEFAGDGALLAYRERLRARARHLIKALVVHYESTAEWAPLEVWCERGIELDETDEDLYAALMRAALARAMHGEALRVFERARRRLGDAKRKPSLALLALGSKAADARA